MMYTFINIKNNPYERSDQMSKRITITVSAETENNIAWMQEKLRKDLGLTRVTQGFALSLAIKRYREQFEKKEIQ